MKTYIFSAYTPAEPGAGFPLPFRDEVTITVDHGPEKGDEQEFIDHFKAAIAEWYNAATVTVVYPTHPDEP